jgi:8-oxo-dGTP pyrophosphatase MutT (NUDIX family)
MAMKIFYVGVKAVIHDEEKGYLMLRHASGWLDFPGGRMDEDEDFKDTLERELSEELPGSKLLAIGDLIGSKRVMKDIDNNISLVLLYFNATVELPKQISLSDEHTEYQWVKSIIDIDQADRESENVQIVKKLLS